MRLYRWGLWVSVLGNVWLWLVPAAVSHTPAPKKNDFSKQPSKNACLCAPSLQARPASEEKPSWKCKQEEYTKGRDGLSEADAVFEGCVHFYDEAACERLQSYASEWCGQAFDGITAFESPGLSGVKCLVTAGIYLGDPAYSFSARESYSWEGMTLLAQACQNHLAEACWQLGELQEHGSVWIPPQPVVALDTFRWLCALDSTACVHVARNIEQGIGTEANKTEALAQYESLCDLQNPTAACYYAAALYKQGFGATGKREQIDQALRKACYESDSSEVQRYSCRYVAEQTSP